MGIVMKIVLCDDDGNLVLGLKDLFEQLDPLFFPMAIETCSNGDDLIGLCQRKAFDLIILDIEMQDKNGIVTAQYLRQQKIYTPIVYLTHYSDYKQKAFDLHAFAYLEKPMDKKKLETILKDVKAYHPPKTDHSLNFMEDNGLLTIPSKELIFIEYHLRSIKLITTQSIYFAKEKIGECGERLKPYGFIMTHKSFIVNLLWIQKIQGYDLILKNGEVIPIAQKRGILVRREWNQYLQKTYDFLRIE